MSTNGQPDVIPRPLVIAPVAYWWDLEGLTGGLVPTLNSFVQWANRSPAHSVSITKDLISLDFDPMNRGGVQARTKDASGGPAVTAGAAVSGRGNGGDDYCAACVHERGCGRMDAIVAPHALQKRGGGQVTAHYQCGYGHMWSCNFVEPE